MVRNFTALFAWMLLLSSTTGTQAALIANGDFTTDTDTGLDWLDHSVTAGLSFNQVTAELGAGGLFEGWQVATLDQAHTFLTNAGWIGPFDPGNVSNVGFVANFKALTTSLLDDPAGDFGALSFTDDFADQLGSDRFVDDQGTGITNYSFTTPIDPSIAHQDTGTFLVHTSAIPVPAALWLFLSGLAGLSGIARFRKTLSVS